MIPPCRHFEYSKCTTTNETNNTHRPSSCALLASRSSHRQVKGRLPAGIGGGRQAA